MKKILTVLFAAFILLGMTACDGGRTYAADGEYTAFEVHLHNGAPMLTTVTVTIEDDEITGYYIDALQSDDTTFEWNEETKKELGDDYNMVEYGGATAEWYEQAELIEAYWLENGIDAMETNSETYITNISGVTIKDGMYAELAQEAVQQAKDGVIKAYKTSMSHGAAQVTWAELHLDDEGNVEDIIIDVLQSEVADDTFAWDEDSKQEKGYEYKMHYNTYSATDDSPTLEEYETWLSENDKLEWFEQADMVADYIVENGWEDSFVVQDVDDLSAVSVTTSDYEEVLTEAFNKLG